MGGAPAARGPPPDGSVGSEVGVEGSPNRLFRDAGKKGGIEDFDSSRGRGAQTAPKLGEGPEEFAKHVVLAAPNGAPSLEEDLKAHRGAHGPTRQAALGGDATGFPDDVLVLDPAFDRRQASEVVLYGKSSACVGENPPTPLGVEACRSKVAS